MYVPRTIIEEYSPRHSGLPMLFVHTPKCGGRFVYAAFHRHSKNCISLNHPCLSGHMKWTDYKDRLPILGSSIANYKTFSVVCNPYAWHVSWFNYIRSYKGGKGSGYHIEHMLFRKMAFSDYIDWLDDPAATRSQSFDMGKQVSDWVVSRQGNVAVNYILRQETLERDLLKMTDKLQLRIKLPKKPVNTSGNGIRYQNYYSAQDVDKITTRHKRDLELLNYSFENEQ